MAGGWIKLYWKTKDSIVGSNLLALGLWTHLLLSVSHTRRILRNGEVLEPGEAIISARELAKLANCSDRTIQRLLKLFEREGMIRVVHVSRNGTHLSICNWGRYQHSADLDVAEMSHSDDATASKRQRNGAQTESPKSPKSPKIPPPPFPPPEIANGQPGQGEKEEITTWGEVAARLRALGVSKATEAIDAARASGAPPALAMEVVDHYVARPGAWGPGALWERLQLLHPGQSAGQNWAAPSGDWDRAEREAARAVEAKQAARREAERRQREAAQIRAEQAENEALEAEFGPLVDALDRDEAEAILREADPLGSPGYIRRWERGKKVTGIGRDLLLLALREQQTEGAAT